MKVLNLLLHLIIFHMNILNPLSNYVGTKKRVEFKGSCSKQHGILLIMEK